MKQYTISVKASIPYPLEKEYKLEAGGFHTAIARAIKQYRREIGRKKISDLIVKANLQSINLTNINQ